MLLTPTCLAGSARQTKAPRKIEQRRQDIENKGAPPLEGQVDITVGHVAGMVAAKAKPRGTHRHAHGLPEDELVA